MSVVMSRTAPDHPIVRFLDQRFFPSVVTYVISRPHIIVLLALIIALEYPQTPAVVMLMLGNYTNVISASASAIVLRQQSVHHEESIERHDTHTDAFDQILARLDVLEGKLFPESHDATQAKE